MKRLLSTIGPAVLGATAGHVAHQLLHQQSDEDPHDLVVTAPLANVACAVIVSKLFCRRSRVAAFVVGFGLSAALGTSLDESIPGLSDMRERLTAHAH